MSKKSKTKTLFIKFAYGKHIICIKTNDYEIVDENMFMISKSKLIRLLNKYVDKNEMLDKFIFAIKNTIYKKSNVLLFDITSSAYLYGYKTIDMIYLNDENITKFNQDNNTYYMSYQRLLDKLDNIKNFKIYKDITSINDDDILNYDVVIYDNHNVVYSI